MTSFPLWGNTVNSVGVFLPVMFLYDTWMGVSNGLWILTYFSSFAECPFLSYILRVTRYPGSILDSLKDFVTVRFGQFLISPSPKSHTNLFYKARCCHYSEKHIYVLLKMYFVLGDSNSEKSECSLIGSSDY